MRSCFPQDGFPLFPGQDATQDQGYQDRPGTRSLPWTFACSTTRRYGGVSCMESHCQLQSFPPLASQDGFVAGRLPNGISSVCRLALMGAWARFLHWWREHGSRTWDTNLNFRSLVGAGVQIVCLVMGWQGGYGLWHVSYFPMHWRNGVFFSVSMFDIHCWLCHLYGIHLGMAYQTQAFFFFSALGRLGSMKDDL